MRYSLLLVPVLSALAAVTPAPARAQQPAPSALPAPAPTAEVAVLRQCTAYADARNADSAYAAGKKAETLFRQRVEANARDVEALVGLARALSQCLVPRASFISQGQLSSDAMELLDQAIELQPDHWLARYVMGSIAYRSPAFLGRGKRAVQEFEYLLRLQGDKTDNPMYARVFELRGMQLSRSGNADSARALWSRGSTLFPDDSALKALVARSGTPSAEQPVKQPTAAIGSPGASTLAAVRVVASAAPPPSSLPSVREVPRSQVLMTAGGGADVFQAVQSQPGTTRVGEGSDIYTRGGDAAETSLLVNGGRLLSLSRFEGLNGGLFGALEPFVVKSVRYSSGGFSARYGNALSGVIDIETDGRPRERQMRAGVSLVQASGTARLPFTKKVGGWVNGRASQTAALLATHGRSDEFLGAPHSEEIIASIVANPSPTSELRATAIVERDNARRILTAAGWRGPFHAAGDTRAALLSSRWLSPRAPIVVRGSVAGSSRSSDWQFGVLSRERDERSLLSRVDVDWQLLAPMTLRAGLEHGAFTRAERGSLPTTPSVAVGAPMRTLGAGDASANQVGAYGETELVRGPATLVVGLRADRLPGESDVTFDPRIALSVRTEVWTARLSSGVFHQGRWRPDAAIPNAGVPSGTPTQARHVVAGIERNGVASVLRAEAYTKRYRRYQAFGSGTQIAGGIARGLDLLAQRTDIGGGPLSGWLAYSFMDATSTLADGRRVPSSFDINQSATGSLTAKVTDDWSLGYTIRYGSGAPMTPIVGTAQDAQGFVTPVYGATMGERLPAYRRMDARVMRFIRTPQFLLTTFVEVINAGNHRNVSGVAYDASYRNREPIHTFFSNRTIVAGGEFQFR